MNLLGWSGVAHDVLLSWSLSDDPMLIYAAMLTGNRALIASENDPDWDWDAIGGRISRALECDNRIVWRGACSLMTRILQKAPGQEVMVKKIIADTEEKQLPCVTFLREELTWELNRKPEVL